MSWAFAIQSLASLVAIAALVGFAGWARISRAPRPLDEAGARALLAAEFPGEATEPAWIAADGAGAIARSGDVALLVFRLGDSFVARHAPWGAVAGGRVSDGRLTVRLHDVGAPVARFALGQGGRTPMEALAC